VKNAAANQPVKFSVSGEGLISNAAASGGEGQPAGPAGASPAPSSSAGSSGVLWFVVSAIVILVGGVAFVLWRRGATAKKVEASPKNAKPAAKARAQAQGQPAKSEPADMLDVLKDELFQLETDKLNGKISQEEYEKTKAGLDTLFRRQMKRK